MINFRLTLLPAVAALGLSNLANAQATDTYDSDDGQLSYTVIDSVNLTVGVSKGELLSEGADITIPATVVIDGKTYTVAQVPENGFSEAGIKSVTFESDTIEIGNGAFNECTKLVSVTANTITRIDGNAFTNCVNLVDFDFTKVRDEIGWCSFMYCASLENVTTSTTLQVLGSSAFKECDNLKTVSIRSPYLESLEYGTFLSDTSLTDVYLCDGLKKIENSVFQYCSKLTSFTAPSTLKEIGDYAFGFCSALETLNLNFGLDSLKENTFTDCGIKGRLELPITIKKMKYGAFYNNVNLTEVCIPRSIEQIGNSCFSGCDNLKKATFEGGSNLKVSDYVFAGDSALEEITFGEGIENIGSGIVASCANLRTVNLPSTLKSIGDKAFAYCESIDSVNCYALNPPELASSECFTEISSSAKLLVPDPSLYNEGFSNFFGGGIGKLYSFETTPSAGSDKPVINITNGSELFDVFRAISEKDDENPYKEASIGFSGDIKFGFKDLNYAELSASNIFSMMDKLLTIDNFDATFDGDNVINLTARNSGLFGTIGSLATIDKLVFLNSLLYVDLSDTSLTTNGDDIEINLLAKKNSGKVKMFGFSGDIIVDSELAKDKQISVNLVDENEEDAELNGYLHIGDVRSTGNGKRCITIKQNLGVKRPSTKTTKVAISKSVSTKSLTSGAEYSEEELLKPVREFSDEEFASGAVAYWLNYSGPGYTGDYTAKWSQGKTVPVVARTIGGVSNALYKVNYVETNGSHITTAPVYANNGSDITITYDETPESVTIGGEEFKEFGAKSMTVTFDHAKVINITFKKNSPTSFDEPKVASIKTHGLTITVGASAPVNAMRLYTLAGKLIATSDGQTITAPAKGIYMLSVDGKPYKVALK
ncbi:MAG: leucine-rich repeat domain-containing protein [Marinilabiliaceae bacterium]